LKVPKLVQLQDMLKRGTFLNKRNIKVEVYRAKTYNLLEPLNKPPVRIQLLKAIKNSSNSFERLFPGD
jgi:hypothetical protein